MRGFQEMKKSQSSCFVNLELLTKCRQLFYPLSFSKVAGETIFLLCLLWLLLKWALKNTGHQTEGYFLL